MGTGRTLRKESHVRPCKTPAGKARKSKAQRARERRPRIALLEVDAHLRERRLDVPVRGQNEVPSVEYLEEGIYAALGDRAVDLGHRRRP